MNYKNLMKLAKILSQECHQEYNRCYNTRFDPPKKEPKRNVSANVKKVFQKMEQDEKKQTDTSTTNSTTVVQESEQYPSHDDDLASPESKIFYEKYMEKVKDVGVLKPVTPEQIEKLRNARKKGEKKNGRCRKSSSDSSDSKISQQSEANCKNNITEKKKQNRKPPATPLDVEAVLQLVKENLKKEKEPKLLTAKQKERLEKQQKAKEDLELNKANGKEQSITNAALLTPNPSQQLQDVYITKYPAFHVNSVELSTGDVQRKKRRRASNKKSSTKIPIESDGDSEFDSELDDFIVVADDEEEDYSLHIKEIFGYDKSKYQNEVFDDRNMESNFAQIQREEFISKKLGIKEDLEDMKLEAMEKKRKIMKKQRLN